MNKWQELTSFSYSLLLGQSQFKLQVSKNCARGRQNFASNVTLYPCERSRQNHLVSEIRPQVLRILFQSNRVVLHRAYSNVDLGHFLGAGIQNIWKSVELEILWSKHKDDIDLTTNLESNYQLRVYITQFLTRFEQCDWFLDALKICTEHGREKWRLGQLSKHTKQYFRVLSFVLEHSRTVSSTYKKY